MPKKPKLRSVVRRKKRPKSVYSKGWQTRRARMAAATLASLPNPKPEYFNVQAIQDELNSLPKGAPDHPGANLNTTGSAIPSRSEVSGGDAILRTVMRHRDEQLCCFVADMMTIRRGGVPTHAPIMLTRSQAEAIEDLLCELGYSIFGKSSHTNKVRFPDKAA